MKRIIRKRLVQAKRRIEHRLRAIRWSEQPKPMLAASNIQYELADRGRGLAAGGIGAMHLVAQRSGLVAMIDEYVHVLKRHLPYHESDHVLNVAYNLLCGGGRIEHIEQRRHDEVFLDALGAQRIPDPTTEGDFCRRADFQKVRLRGDTNFSQTEYLDAWDEQKVQFTFGIAALPNLVEIAENLPKRAFSRLPRPAKYTLKTEPRARPENVKERIVVERGFDNLRLEKAEVAEFRYRPTKCRKTYRMVVLKKTLWMERGQQRLFAEIRWFFYLTNDWQKSSAEIVRDANGRCNQENLIAQLQSGVKALAMPVDNLLSNWAYMVMAAVAWNLKVWSALLLPEQGRWAHKHREEKQTLLKMEFATFLQAMVQLPAQIVRTGRRIVYRLLSWNPWQHVFFRLLDQLRLPLRC